MRTFSLWLIFSFLLAASYSKALANPQELRLGVANWCPYTCPGEEQPGIVIEYLTWLLAKNDIKLVIVNTPWQRAVELSRLGQIDGLVTLVEGEADWLLKTNTPTMTHQDCFFVNPDDTWTFNGIHSLDNKLLGSVVSYGYPPQLANYIEANKHNPNKIYEISASNVTHRLANMLYRERIGLYVNDRFVNRWQLKNANEQPKNAGCLDPEPFYLGLSPQTQNAKEIRYWLNKELKRLTNIQYRRAIKLQYLRFN